MGSRQVLQVLNGQVGSPYSEPTVRLPSPRFAGILPGMRRLLLLFCALLPTACRQAPGTHVVVRAIFVRHSGPVDNPWSEQYDISSAGVEFRRTGEPGSPINAGTWQLEFDASAVARLCDRLAAVDCSRIQEIVPDDVLDGGGSALYQLHYAGGGTCDVWYRGGITYAGAEPLVAAVDEFVRGLTLPAAASSRMVLP